MNINDFQTLLDSNQELNEAEARVVLTRTAFRLAELGVDRIHMLHQVNIASEAVRFRNKLEQHWAVPGKKEAGVPEQRNLLTGELEPPGDPNAPGWSRNTPERVLQKIRKFAPIGLDPCSNKHSTVDALVSWEGPPDDTDGLEASWLEVLADGTIVFWQPPWNNLLPWARKAARERDENEVESIGWTNHDHSTEWCQLLLSTCDAYGLWRTRENHPSGGLKSSGSKWCNTIWYYGHRSMTFRDHFWDVAHVARRAGRTGHDYF